ncbi:3-methyl-2-oxobutanoate hydroxymethyltransferase [bacterium]|nr:3-methyl-2-oxobutanoate hydroxymethyltransferase [bacterium]
MSMEDKRNVVNLRAMKEKGEKIVSLTAYDYTMARLLEEAGVDIILVGDSAAMVCGGHEHTLPVTMDQMIYHTQMVSRGVSRALLVADMPFLSFQVNPDEAVRNAGRFLKEAGADAVKLEGGAPVIETVQRLVDAGIPVMGHLGLTPQSIRNFGGYRLRGKEKEEADQYRRDARLLEDAGAFSIVLEKIPAALAAEITREIAIPTIGIGAGPDCDGQVLVTYDMLGLFEEFKPKFVRRYAELATDIRNAVQRYADDVRQSRFPSAKESY